MMTLCCCMPGDCMREAGILPAKTRAVFCIGRPVVARHLPTIWWYEIGHGEGRHHVEPIEDEL